MKFWAIVKNLFLMVLFFFHTFCGPTIQFYGCIEGDCQDGIGIWLDGSGTIYKGKFENGKRKGLFDDIA